MFLALAAGVVVLALTIWYFRFPKWRRAAGSPKDDSNLLQEQREEFSVLDLPDGYYFHPGHTWMAHQGRDTVRVGIDSFAAHLLGTLQHVRVIGEQRWVRQGQKLLTLTSEGQKLEMLSPLEGVITAVNPQVIQDPQLAVRDPYGEGWICAMKSAEMESNRRNLVVGAESASWIHNSLDRLSNMVELGEPGLLQDGGTPRRGLLGRLSPEARRQVVSEFFLT